MNADGGAELRTWKIVVNGASGVRQRPDHGLVATGQPDDRRSRYLGLTFQAASVEQGKEVDMAVKVAKAVDFPGEAQVTLVGLPNKVTTDVKKITKDTTDLVFHIKTDKVSPAGNHANLFCQVVVTQNGEPIVHNIGTGHAPDRRPPASQAGRRRPPPPPSPPRPRRPPPPRPSRSSRLEKLRLENKQKAQGSESSERPPSNLSRIEIATAMTTGLRPCRRRLHDKDPFAMSRSTTPIAAPDWLPSASPA